MNKKINLTNTLSFVMILIMLSGYMLYGRTAAAENRNEQQLQQSFDDLRSLTDAVKTTGANVTEVQFRMKWSDMRFKSIEEAEAFRSQLAKKVGIASWDEASQSSVEVYQGHGKTSAGADVEVYVSLSSSTSKNEARIGLSLQIRGKEYQVNSMATMTEDVLRIVVNRTDLPQISSCARGFFNGKLENDLQKQKIGQVLARFDAKVVEKLEEEMVLSYSAYSPLLSTKITTDHKAMNLQIATHTNTIKHQTTLTLGTPIITTEY
jgi:hypothetical protein